MIRMSPMVKDE